MNVGTKSVLFGAHQFLLHPLFVAAGWWKLYGFPCDPRLWVAFFVHDLGYLGKPDMDRPEGESHPRLGAKIMGAFDDEPLNRLGWLARLCDRLCGKLPDEFGPNATWYCLSFYHSRFMARRYGVQHSRLCVADKLATALMPWWLYLPLVNLTGEITEYMDLAHHKEGGRYSNEIRVLTSQREWFASMCDYMLRWIEEHKDGRPDTWTPKQQREEAAEPCL